MKRFIYFAIVAAVVPGFVTDNQSRAQHRPNSRPEVTKTTVGETDRGTAEEQEKIFEACSVSNRPKPDVDAPKEHNAVLCGKAISLPKPPYPEDAKAQKISGIVSVDVVIDEKGRVIWAKAVTGHPLLHEASVKAACRSLHSPATISDRLVKTTGNITYRFVSQ